MTRSLAVLLVAFAALPVRAQTTAPPARPDSLAYPTAQETVEASWSEAFSRLDVLAQTLDAFPATPAEQVADVRTSLSLEAALVAGGLIETTRFTSPFAGADRAAIVTLVEHGFGLANALGLVAVEAANGREAGGEPDWAAHAAAVREQIEIIRPALATLGITPR